ncbi:hypothetical protein EN836_16680 [Mesorhizobium sp. M1C.F.Ca.ET.193.01.1.1]|uniref:hypothetical protein n=1 Tax=unclassified Mesorhizobium TaxID=325217 RepID=UPI000FD1BA9A|nr:MULTISPECIES: hypothetical protein [unclassified Mesorhizobium]TGS99007.1 hypothetical protein EN820_35410 [bacterium M00.F.Ca.ET.177.01.1.1]TGQ53048.1 hypothetical protein EN853_16675 [Mesorhizobium sp. M1C.F.Ca.ET.210.01.1.1]TGQ70326.1 hypothetical protein EN855_016685 [Mesorhizobium sp. M1C.F.Ca.ET.212.01.1.1]TGR06656.1 hypothetical protein EN847_16680 [Mesorhizobium sp. M1C.F.Ca.ET.204.01.1.1]TGR27179.1 hypothetical protein EN839_16680 [Mesorhizobium sp. M1C.F.Ca.ET.196.01.1.1]
MDTYSEIVAALLDWVVNRPGAILMLSATLPLMLLLQKGRLLGYGALAVLVGAVAVIFFGIENPVGAVIVLLAYSLLVSVALLSIRKRLTQIEDRLALVMATLGDLEVAEERRQTYNAKRPSVSRVQPRRKRPAGTIEQNASASATESPGREGQSIPGPLWQELQTLDARPGSALPASTRPAERGPLSKARQEGQQPS